MSASALPADPALSAPAALSDAIGELRPGGRMMLPAVVGVEPAMLARWLYRRWQEGAEWRPFLHIEPALLGSAPIEESFALATGGWVFLGAGWRSLPDLDALASRYGVGLLLEDEGPAIEVPPDWAARLRSLDALHIVATDPALRRARSSLLSHARSASILHLSGPMGAGKSSLVRWAHARLSEEPLDLVGGPGATRPSPGRWALYEEVGALEPDARYWLSRAVTDEAVAPTPALRTGGKRPDHPAFAALRGESPALVSLLNDAVRAARSPAPVLILGEAGTGKELLARAIHEASGRSGPFEAVDVHTLPRELVESELFGHVRGAFTGAVGDRPGAFRRAQGGTLFLDELGNLELSAQAKLLRALQERQVRPVGGDRPIPVDVRVVAATNADLASMAARGVFRADLLHRVNAITLRLPPLRERVGDILPLAASFLADARGDSALPADWIEPEAAEALQSWPWEGNVRELWGAMSQAAAFSEPGQRVGMAQLPGLARSHRQAPIVTTSSDTDREGWELERRVVSRLLSVSLEIPGMDQRGPDAIRNAVFVSLGGRPIRPDALAVLERYAWRGELPGLVSDMAALCANVAGPVDRAALTLALPHLLPGESAARLRVLMAPVRQADGRISGLEHAFWGDTLLVGRAASWEELERGAATRGELFARLAAVRGLAGGGIPELLGLSEPAQLSRAHFAVVREPRGLTVHALPGVSLPVFVRPLGEERWTPARPAAEAGRGAEVQVREEAAGPVLLRLFVFSDDEAFDALSPSIDIASAADTVSRSETEPARAGRVWALEPGERALLNAIVLGCEDGDFGAQLRAGLLAQRDNPDHTRLAAYLLRNRPAQYCARLYDFADNAALREELVAALLATGEPRLRLARMPDQLSAVLERAMEPSPRSHEGDV